MCVRWLLQASEQTTGGGSARPPAAFRGRRSGPHSGRVELTGVNRNTAILFFHKLREVIAARLAAETPFLEGEVKVDENYFGGRCKGSRGRGAPSNLLRTLLRWASL